MSTEHEVAERKSLVACWAEACTPPDAPFDPGGSWTHRYEQRSAHSLLADGELRLVRQPAEAGSFVLDATLSRKAFDGHLYDVQTVLQGRSDKFGATERWTVRSRVQSGAAGEPAANSNLLRAAEVRNGELRLRFGGQLSVTPVRQPVLCDVALFEAVQRLPVEGTEPLRFVLVEEGDMPSTVHQLTYRGRHEVLTAGGPALLSAYQHLGPGVLPTTYWLDSQGRLLLMLNGMVMYVLVEEDGRAIALQPMRR